MFLYRNRQWCYMKRIVQNNVVVSEGRSHAGLMPVPTCLSDFLHSSQHLSPDVGVLVRDLLPSLDEVGRGSLHRCHQDVGAFTSALLLL